jgi:8-oxo-dGTP diphosphatase
MTSTQSRISIIPVTDTVLFTIEDSELKVLVVNRQREPFNKKKTLPGTYIRDGESSKTAALRALKNKAGVKDIYIEQLYTFDEMGRDPRGQYMSVVYFAVANEQSIHLNISKNTQNPEFTGVNTKLGFDHNNIVVYALERLRSKLEYTSISQSLLPELFTLTELQKVYEIILGKGIDKRNFRKKFLSLGLIMETGEMKKGGRMRPAMLYRFKLDKVTEISRWF